MTNLSSLLERAAADHPDHPALRLDDLVLTYAQLREAAGRMSALLAAHGVQPGDRVGIMLPNVPAFPISFYGALAAGAVVAHACRARPLIPVGDPHLSESLAFRNP